MAQKEHASSIRAVRSLSLMLFLLKISDSQSLSVNSAQSGPEVRAKIFIYSRIYLI